MTQRFPREARLRKRVEFLDVQQRGRPTHARHFVALAVPARAARGRLGVTVSGKVGIAVTRNRIKRWVREFARRGGLVPAGADVVVIAKRSAAEVRSYHEVAADLGLLGERLARREV